ncbi:MAG TPA: hypothetical protein VFL41_06925 [Gaiellaceae bacterium]|nr:hypothetical protein [Gaiellaceae bacterium]
MPRREGGVARRRDERLRLRVDDRRTVAVDEPAQELRGDLRDRVGDEGEPEDLGAAPEQSGGERQEQPEQTDAPELRERDEDAVQPVLAVEDDPALEPAIEP